MNTTLGRIAIRYAHIVRSLWGQLPRLKRGDGLVTGVGGLL